MSIEQLQLGRNRFFLREARQAGGQNWLVVRTEILEQTGAGDSSQKLSDDEISQIFEHFFQHATLRVGELEPQILKQSAPELLRGRQCLSATLCRTR